MMTISYEYEGALYVNLTNRCDCACVFCLRHNGHKGSIYADNLWLEHEPTRQVSLNTRITLRFLRRHLRKSAGFPRSLALRAGLMYLTAPLPC